MQPQDHDMNAYDHDKMVDVSFRFVSWLKVNFPEVKDSLLPSYFSSFGEFVREAPVSFWGEVGHLEYDELTAKSDTGESILDRVIAIVRETPQNVHGHILVGFVEAHMFPRPDSPLAKEMGEALGMDLSDLC